MWRGVFTDVVGQLDDGRHLDAARLVGVGGRLLFHLHQRTGEKLPPTFKNVLRSSPTIQKNKLECSLF